MVRSTSVMPPCSGEERHIEDKRRETLQKASSSMFGRESSLALTHPA